MEYYIHMNHIRGAVLQLESLREPGPPEARNLDLRRKYLMGEIDEKTWKTGLFNLERKAERIQAFRDVFTLVYDVSWPILQSAGNGPESMKSAYEELRQLVEFSRNAVDDICKRFNCTSPYPIPFPDVAPRYEGVNYY